MSWKNFGDVNFLENGGYLVRPHWTKKELEAYPALSSQYDVFQLLPAYEEGKVFAGLTMIDIDDFDDSPWFSKNAIFNRLGTSEDKMSDEEIAIAMVDFVGIHNAGGVAYNVPYPETQDYIISVDDAIQWMKDLDADEFI